MASSTRRRWLSWKLFLNICMPYHNSSNNSFSTICIWFLGLKTSSYILAWWNCWFCLTLIPSLSISRFLKCPKSNDKRWNYDNYKKIYRNDHENILCFCLLRIFPTNSILMETYSKWIRCSFLACMEQTIIHYFWSSLTRWLHQPKYGSLPWWLQM